MKTFDGSYTFLFVIAITLHLFETMDTAQICVDVPDVGRVCVPDPDGEKNGYLEIERGIEITEGKNHPEGQGKMGNGCLALDPRDCPPEDFEGAGEGSFGGGIGAPCPTGTRADQNGHCRQELF